MQLQRSVQTFIYFRLFKSFEIHCYCFVRKIFNKNDESVILTTFGNFEMHEFALQGNRVALYENFSRMRGD